MVDGTELACVSSPHGADSVLGELKADVSAGPKITLVSSEAGEV